VKQGKLSFVIPTFNCAAWLPHTVKSCQEQTIKDIEIVIVDDCSTDTTDQYINWLLKQGDKRIKYFRNGKNLGRSETRNIGNREATSPIICVMDSDDLAVATRAEWTLKKMKHSQACYGSAVAMDALGNVLKELPAGPVTLADCLEKKTNGIVHSTVAYTKELALKFPYSSGEIADLGIDDWDQQIRIMSAGVKFELIPDTLCAYRIRGGAITQTRDEKKVTEVKEKILEGLKCGI
jgi:teichuronic acid biosynthesis glycosyltransferase TuaG